MRSTCGTPSDVKMEHRQGSTTLKGSFIKRQKITAKAAKTVMIGIRGVGRGGKQATTLPKRSLLPQGTVCCKLGRPSKKTRVGQHHSRHCKHYINVKLRGPSYVWILQELGDFPDFRYFLSFFCLFSFSIISLVFDCFSIMICVSMNQLYLFFRSMNMYIFPCGFAG